MGMAARFCSGGEAGIPTESVWRADLFVRLIWQAPDFYSQGDFDRIPKCRYFDTISVIGCQGIMPIAMREFARFPSWFLDRVIGDF
jgi:hypothetical protein